MQRLDDPDFSSNEHSFARAHVPGSSAQQKCACVRTARRLKSSVRYFISLSLSLFLSPALSFLDPSTPGAYAGHSGLQGRKDSEVKKSGASVSFATSRLKFAPPLTRSQCKCQFRQNNCPNYIHFASIPVRLLISTRSRYFFFLCRC